MFLKQAEKILGQYKVTLLRHSEKDNLGAMTIWASRMGKEVYHSGIKNKFHVEEAYFKLTKAEHIENFLRRKIRLEKSPSRELQHESRKPSHFFHEVSEGHEMKARPFAPKW